MPRVHSENECSSLLGCRKYAYSGSLQATSSSLPDTACLLLYMMRTTASSQEAVLRNVVHTSFMSMSSLNCIVKDFSKSMSSRDAKYYESYKKSKFCFFSVLRLHFLQNVWHSPSTSSEMYKDVMRGIFFTKKFFQIDSRNAQIPELLTIFC